MSDLLALVVARNEAGRYLAGCVSWLTGIADQVLVFDDGSTDDTVAVAEAAGALVIARRPDAPTFMDNESALRQQAWDALETACTPTEGAWVMAVDADEFPVAPPGIDERTLIDSIVVAAETEERTGIVLRIPEVFARDAGGGLLVRTDGWWDGTFGCRIIRWRSGMLFAPRTMGGGSVPYHGVSTHPCGPLRFLHVGYLTPEDRDIKYRRYMVDSGHNPKHVASINTPPTLEPWTGKTPPSLVTP